MIDSKLAGTGNSRFLKSVAAFKTLYPTYDNFVAALVAGTLPIDLNGVNPEGWTQQGTPLNKSTLLSDATATKLGLDGDPTVNEALDALFTFADNGKTLCAEAVTGMGVSTSSDDTFETIAGNIKRITEQVTATPYQVRTGYKFVDKDGVLREGTIPNKMAATYTPSNQVQTISAGQYLVGPQTIAAANILIDDYRTYTTGSNAPSYLELVSYDAKKITNLRSFTILADSLFPRNQASDDCVVGLCATRTGSYWTVLKLDYDRSAQELLSYHSSSISNSQIGQYFSLSHYTTDYNQPVIDVLLTSTTKGVTEFCPNMTYHATLVGY